MYYEDGQLKAVYPFKADTLNGTAKTYHPNGQIYSVRFFQNGAEDGTSKWYDEAGNLGMEMPLTAGKRNGISRFYENGHLSEEKTFNNDDLRQVRQFYANGTLKSEEAFFNGEPQGIHKFYDSDGSLSYMVEGDKILSPEEPCGTDMCYTQRTIDGILVYEMRACADGEKSPYEAPCPPPTPSGDICVEKIKQPDGFVIEREYRCPW